VAEIDVGKLVKLLVGVTVAIAALNVAMGLAQLVEAPQLVVAAFTSVDLDLESSIPTWFSITMMLACAGALALVAGRARRSAERGARHWAGLAVIFVVLSIDEQVALHERAIVPVRELMGVSGAFYMAWVIPALAVLVVLALMYVPFVLRLPAALRGRMVLAACLFVGGAVGLEMVGGWLLVRYGAGPQTGIVVIAEEVMELLGLIVLLRALLVHLQATTDRLEVSAAGTRARRGGEAGHGTAAQARAGQRI
jgi:hypothetical protein